MVSKTEVLERLQEHQSREAIYVLEIKPRVLYIPGQPTSEKLPPAVGGSELRDPQLDNGRD